MVGGWVGGLRSPKDTGSRTNCSIVDITVGLDHGSSQSHTACHLCYFIGGYTHRLFCDF